MNPTSPCNKLRRGTLRPRSLSFPDHLLCSTTPPLLLYTVLLVRSLVLPGSGPHASATIPARCRVLLLGSCLTAFRLLSFYLPILCLPRLIKCNGGGHCQALPEQDDLGLSFVAYSQSLFIVRRQCRSFAPCVPVVAFPSSPSTEDFALKSGKTGMCKAMNPLRWDNKSKFSSDRLVRAVIHKL